MPETFSGTVSFVNALNETLVVIDADALPTPIILQDALGNRLLEITSSAQIILGGGGVAGEVRLRLGDGVSQTIHLTADGATLDAGGSTQNGLLLLRNEAGDISISAAAQSCDIIAGGNGADGEVALHRAATTATEDFEQAAIHLDAEDGSIDLRNASGNYTLRIQGDSGNIRAGGAPDADGDLLLFRSGAGIDINDDAQAAIYANANRGRITFRDADGNYSMRLDGDGGNIRAGGAPGVDGDLLLYRSGEDVDIDDAAQAAIHADANAGRIDFRDAEGRRVLRLAGDGANIFAGGAPGSDGDLVLFRGADGINNLDASQSSIHADAGASRVTFRDADGNSTLRLDGGAGNFRGGGAPGVDGDLLLFRSGDGITNDGAAAIHADAGSGLINFRNNDNENTMRLEGDSGNIRAGGGRDVDGDLLLFRSGRGININDASQAAIHADADNGSISFRDEQGRPTLLLQGDSGNIRAGAAPGVDGDLVLFRAGANIDINDASQAAIHMDADGGIVNFRDSAGQLVARIEGDSGNIRLGGTPTADGDIVLFPSGANIDILDASQATIHLNGDSGDIVLRNADCAEEFAVACESAIHAGAVMVLNDAGLVQPSSEAYDKRVVGVVSGAGAYKPGIVLDKHPEQANRSPIALMGKVFCQVSAEAAPVQVGDLLTTSDIPGFAMKASDPGRAFGSVLGKALQPLPAGRGLIPVLIALQ